MIKSGTTALFNKVVSIAEITNIINKAKNVNTKCLVKKK